MITNVADRKKTELENCTYVKTILMIIVVIYHCILFFGGNWLSEKPIYTSVWMKKIAMWLNSFHIYTFTLVSGYLFYYIREERGGYARYLPFVWNKFKRLVVPYFFVSFIWVIPIEIKLFGYGPSDIVKKFVLAEGPSQLWFIIMLFMVFAFFWPMANFVKKRAVLGALLMIILYGVGGIGQILFRNCFQIWTAAQFLFFFWLGFVIRQYECKWMKKIPGFVWLIAHVSIFVINNIVEESEWIIAKVLSIGTSFFLHLIGAIMGFVILQKIASMVNTKNKYLVFLGERSMPVYMLHQQLVCIIAIMLNGKVNPYIHAVIIFIGVMVGALVISSILLKFKLTRFLLGAKPR